MYPKCRVCGKDIDPDSPSDINGGAIVRNPYTFRRAWLHYWCHEIALESIMGVQSRDRYNFNSRYDEYMSLEE